jgi:hypothetical protein
MRAIKIWSPCHRFATPGIDVLMYGINIIIYVVDEIIIIVIAVAYVCKTIAYNSLQRYYYY